MAEGNSRVVRKGSGGFRSFLLIGLWIQIVLLTGLGLISGASSLVVGISALALVVIATIATLARTALVASSAVAAGLVGCAVTFAGYSQDATLSLLYVMVVVAAVSLYHDRRPLAFATALSVGGLAVMSLIWGTFVWSEWATQSAFIVGLALVVSLSWQRLASPPSAAEDRFRLSFEKAPIGMAVLKPSGEFITVNPALADLLGLSAGDLTGANIRSVVHGDDMTEVGEAWEKIGNRGDHTASLWARCVTAEGTTIWARLSLALVPRSSDRSAMVVLQLEDMGSSRSEQARLENLIAGKDRFVAAVGSEVREPLSRLIDLTGNDSDLAAIRDQAVAAMAMVDDLVVSARASAGAPAPVSLPIDAGTLCEDVVAQIPDAEDVRVETSAGTIWADPTLTRQVLFGLVANAVKFGGPNVTVESVSSGPDTVVRVFDDGPAVPEDDRERIFNSDLRHGHPATRPASVGLSLTVGRLLARQMDGDITYRRTADGHNVYELRLPSEELRAGYSTERGGIDISA